MAENLRPLARETLDRNRFRLAHDGANLVGIAGSYAQEVTVPVAARSVPVASRG